MIRTKPVVALDGPAGSGKTTVSRQTAQQLDYVVLDTGALYRTLALSTHRAGLTVDSPEFAAHCERLVADNQIVLGAGNAGTSRVWLAGEEVSDAIRTPQVTALASVVSAVPAVRASLLELQRTLGQNGGVVVEGRDIGSVVFPNAEAKFYLTASVERRARRRFDEMEGGAEAADLQSVMRDVVERDRRDSEREIAPLRCADDAERIDSTDMDIPQVVAHIVRRVREIERQLAARAGQA